MEDGYESKSKILLTKSFCEKYGCNAFILLNEYEMIMSQKVTNTFELFETTFDFQIITAKYHILNPMLQTMEFFAKLNLAPLYYSLQLKSKCFLKIKTYKTSLKTWLLKNNNISRNEITLQLQKVSNAIDLFHMNGLHHGQLSLNNIFITKKNEIIFTNFNLKYQKLSLLQEYTLFSIQIYQKDELLLLSKKIRIIIHDFLLLHLGNKLNRTTFLQTLTNIQENQQIWNNIENNSNQIQIDNTIFLLYFIETNFGLNSIKILIGHDIKIQKIKLLVLRYEYVNRSWVFCINNQYIIKLTRTTEKKYTNIAKYEILMHKKFSEAGHALKYQMAPKLLNYNTWEYNSSSMKTKNHIVVGWMSEKIHLVSHLLEIPQSKKIIQDIFDGIQTCFLNMTKSGLRHADCHVSNWGYKIDEITLQKKFMLFDFEYACNGIFKKTKLTSQKEMISQMSKNHQILMAINEKNNSIYYNNNFYHVHNHTNYENNYHFELNSNFLIHFNSKCTFSLDQDIILVAYGIHAARKQIHPQNLHDVILAFVQMHKNVQKYCLLTPPIVVFNNSDPLAIIESYPLSKNDVIGERITSREKNWYLEYFGFEEWQKTTTL